VLEALALTPGETVHVVAHVCETPAKGMRITRLEIVLPRAPDIGPGEAGD